MSDGTNSANASATGTAADEATLPVLPLLVEPRGGLPPVVETAEHLARVVADFAAGTGPVAVDAERASGYRYSHRAYLVQVHRAGAGIALIDPIACPDLSELGAAVADAEWILHAATQDLPCLAELGMRPLRLFDTELAGRLLGYARVGLGYLVESALSVRLEKEHAAVDWSTRPLPESWLRYAALDVDLLPDLRDILADELRTAGKADWAAEEFATLTGFTGPPPRVEPWRRTSGLHRVRNRRQLAVVRELWTARDALARERDISPGRVLPDAAVVAAALAMPATQDEMADLAIFKGRSQRRQIARWFGAVDRARHLPDSALPAQTLRYDGPPPARAWADRDPVAATRLAAARTAVGAVADEHTMPVENLLAPDVLRRITWEPPQDTTPAGIAAAMRELGAREWQIALTARPVSEAIASSASPAPDA